MKSLTIFIIFSALLSAQAMADTTAGNRKTGLFFGAGAQKSLADIKDTAGDAKFEGWGYAIEVGLDVPWNNWFGNTLSVEYKLAELTNTQKSTDAIENADLKSSSIRLGFFFNNFGLGYGQSSDNAEIHQVSTTTGSTTSKIKGDITEIYANYNIQMSDEFRFTLEIQKRIGDLDTYELDETKFLMKFFVISAF